MYCLYVDDYILVLDDISSIFSSDFIVNVDKS